MIENNKFGYAEQEMELNWAAEHAKRELKKHREAVVIDHPDKSVTEAKLADNAVSERVIESGSVTEEKLGFDVLEKFGGLSELIDKEKKEREASDGELNERLSEVESKAHTHGNKSVIDGITASDVDNWNGIKSETEARIEADNAFNERMAGVEEKAHIHNNKSVLDGISDSDIEKWNGIREQVTQSELNAVKAYLEELCFGFSDEFKRIYTAIGITVYDGGIFGQAQNEIALDGGAFDDVGLSLFDCGGFEPITVNTGGGIAAGAVIDGGNY